MCRFAGGAYSLIFFEMMDIEFLTSEFHNALSSGMFAGLIIGFSAGLMGFAIDFLYNKIRKIS